MGNRPKNAICPTGKLLLVGHLKLYSGYAGVIFSLRESYIAALRQLYYIRLQNCPKGNITCEANITGVANITRHEANITEKNGNRITITVLFWWGMVDSNHRRHSQQIYSLSPLATRETIHKWGLQGSNL